MKDKILRKVLGMHGSDENLCACSEAYVPGDWGGALPDIYRKLKILEARISKLEDQRNS